MSWRICCQNWKIKASSTWREKQMVKWNRKQKKKNDGTEQLSQWKEGRTGEIQCGAWKSCKGRSWTKSTDK